jgi:3',5'-cyclic AMP phosphodiesterase CpdA
VTTTLRLAHLSDLHLGPLPPVAARELMGKRLTGFLNWHQTRKRIHDMALLERVTADVAAEQPDLILLGGDLVNIGLPAEFERARDFVERLGPPEKVFVVPGNHDIYIGESLAAMQRWLGPWMAGDGGGRARFPYVVRRGHVGIVALNSGAPSLPFYATGELGAEQIAAAGRELAALGREGLFRVVLVHHAPHVGGSRVFRNLLDAPAFEAMLAEVGAELVLHGHNHCTSLAFRATPAGNVPIVGVGSASASGGSDGHRATWHRIAIGSQGATLAVRQADAAGAFTEEAMAIEAA